MTLLIAPAILMGERKQGWTSINKLITIVWLLAIDLFVANVMGVLQWYGIYTGVYGSVYGPRALISIYVGVRWGQGLDVITDKGYLLPTDLIYTYIPNTTPNTQHTY